MSKKNVRIASEQGSEGTGSQIHLHDEKEKKNIVSRIITTVWGTRQTRDEMDSDSLIKTTLKELIIYIVFLVIICIITFGMTATINFYYVNVLMNLLLNSQTDGGTSFPGIGSYQDFWDVHEGPVLSGLYNGEDWYTGDKYNGSNAGFIYFENKILGLPRLRQLRVKKNSCTVHKLFKSSIDSCYDAYSYFSEDQTPFGLYETDQTNMNDTAFFYQSSSKVDAPIISGTISTYGGGGYVKNLATTNEDSLAILKALEAAAWIDRGTRAVFLDLTVYNANINLFCQIRLITEFPATGGAITSYLFRSVKLIRYVTSMDYFVLACEIMFIMFIIYYSIEEALEIKIHKLSYFKEGWNVLDVVILIICYICVAFNFYRIAKVNATLDSLLNNPDQYVEFDTLAYWQIQFNNAIAVTAFLSWIKFFKYISFNKTMTQLTSTLSRCAKDILGFFIMFYIVFFAFAQLGYLLFGATTPDYSTFTTTCFTLFRIILGDFDFPTLMANAPTMGPIYFLSYVFFVFFVLLNMFLAIINDTYADVKSDVDEQKSDFELGDYFKRGYDKILTKMHLKKDKIVDIQNALNMADGDADKEIKFDEWRAELRKRGYGDAEIEAYFAKYDTDGSRNLSEEEQKKMREDLKRQFENIDDDMDKLKKEAEEEELSPEDKETEEKLKEANMVSNTEFNLLNSRVETMELSIGGLVEKIDGLLTKLELIEAAKYRRRESMAKLLTKLNDANTMTDEQKRVSLQKMIKDELEKWDEPLSVTPQNGYDSRAASPPSYNSSNLDVRAKNAWRQQ